LTDVHRRVVVQAIKVNAGHFYNGGQCFVQISMSTQIWQPICLQVGEDCLPISLLVGS
jgi:hypothetical protein